MATLAERILDLMPQAPGLTDREITDQLVARRAPQQAVNQTCRNLEKMGKICRRRRADGRIGNYPTGNAASDKTSARHAAGHALTPISPGRVSGQLGSWSAEIPFEEAAVTRDVPNGPGVYQILQSVEYPRYEGKTRILKIGKSEQSLCQELLNHFRRHTAANRLARIRSRPDISVTVVFMLTGAAYASKQERVLLRKFEDRHWDLPLLNSQRGYDRGADMHYREVQQGDAV